MWTLIKKIDPFIWCERRMEKMKRYFWQQERLDWDMGQRWKWQCKMGIQATGASGGMTWWDVGRPICNSFYVYMFESLYMFMPFHYAVVETYFREKLFLSKLKSFSFNFSWSWSRLSSQFFDIAILLMDTKVRVCMAICETQSTSKCKLQFMLCIDSISFDFVCKI